MFANGLRLLTVKPDARSRAALGRRHCLFLLSAVAAFSAIVPPMVELFRNSSRSDYYSHIPLIPLVSAYLLYHRRTEIFKHSRFEIRRGLPIIGLGLLLYFSGIWRPSEGSPDTTSLLVFSAVLFILGSFVLFYGSAAFKDAAFPLLFLFLMVPVPSPLMDAFVYFLQAGSSEVTERIFAALGVPYLREGFVFHLPMFSIEIAKVCSGIRSTLALVITTVLAAKFFLPATWQRIALVASLLPVVLIKNGIRISVLTLLALHVDQRILFGGFLHTAGGFLFFVPALVLMGVVVWILKKIGGSRRPHAQRS